MRSHQVDNARRCEDSQAASSLTQRHSSSSDQGRHQLTGVLKTHEVCCSDGHPAHQPRPQPRMVIVLADETIAQTEDGRQQKENRQRSFPSEFVDYERGTPARYLFQHKEDKSKGKICLCLRDLKILSTYLNKSTKQM